MTFFGMYIGGVSSIIGIGSDSIFGSISSKPMSNAKFGSSSDMLIFTCKPAVLVCLSF